MSRIFITGSSDGLGLMAGRLLVEWGHRVTLHARNEARAADARRALPQAEAVAIGDVSSIRETRRVAEQVNALGRHDAVIHNVGVGSRRPRIETEDGLSQVFAVNVLAPYLLTALITRPDRLVYVSSGMQASGDARFDDAQWVKRRWNGSQAYSDSKLFVVMLAFAAARLWPAVKSNAITPGWVATKMGGARRARRSRAGRPHAGLAGGERRCGSRGDGPLFLPSEKPAGESGRRTSGAARSAAQLLRRTHGRYAARSAIRLKAMAIVPLRP